MSRRVFNLTDGSTAALRNQHLENQHIRVGDVVIPPGKYADIRGTAKELNDAQIFVKNGALALDELPPMYAARRNLNLDGTTVVEPEPQPPHPPPAESYVDPTPADEPDLEPESSQNE